MAGIKISEDLIIKVHLVAGMSYLGYDEDRTTNELHHPRPVSLLVVLKQSQLYH